MGPERDQLPQSPERQPQHEQSVFDLERMSVEQIQLLDDALSADPDKFEALLSEFQRGFEELPARNIEKAREVVSAMARSESVSNRCIAAFALGPLTRCEHELSTDSLQTALDLWVALLSDRDADVQEEAGYAMSAALRDKHFLPEIAAWIRERLGD